jgi:hypothetical protein
MDLEVRCVRGSASGGPQPRARGEKRDGGMSDLNDAGFWHQRAEEARGIAEAMTLPAAQREMLAIADAYARAADHIERTAGRRAKRRGA